MTDLRLALRLLAREWRAGEIRVLLAAVTLAVASLTTVSFFADRIARALALDANTLLAADLALRSDNPIDPAFEAEARHLGLASSRTVAFLSMAVAKDRPVLAGIKAATAGYPLRGQLRIADAPYGPDRPAATLPASGQAWLDARLAGELRVRPGDSVAVGDIRLKMTAILAYEGERGGNFMALAPRLLMNDADLAATGLLREGSRAIYRLLLAGDPEVLARFRAWAEPRLARGEKMEGLADARPELRQVMDRTRRYLGLAALLSAVLAAAAVHMALRRFVTRHFDQFALLRCFGGRRARLLRLYLIQFAALGLVAGLAGSALGFAAQALMGTLLGDALRLALPLPSPVPLLFGLCTGLALVLAFSLPPLLRLAQVPALRVLRRDLGPARTGPRLAHAAGLAVVGGLLFWQAGEARLGLILVAGLAAAMLATILIVHALLRAVAALAPRLPIAPRLGLMDLRRHASETTLQAMTLSLGLLALLLLTLVRDDLLASWKSRIPPGAPNRFVINIQPEQVAPVRAFLTTRDVADVALHPMVRGRLVSIDGRPVSGADYPEGRARHLAEREFNLSTEAGLSGDNVITSGHWWGPGETGAFSLEEGIAKTLDIKLGDHLGFDIGGLPVTGRVTSLRKVDWDSFRVNFFVVAPPGMLDGLPASYITSFHLPRERGALLADLVAAFPNLTVIDVDQIMTHVRDLMDRVSGAVQLIFLFSLAVGVLVLVAALHARRDERAREIGLWRTLGASRRTVRIALMTEFAVLGGLAGAIAAGAASALAWFLARHVFELPHSVDPLIWLAGILGGAVLVVGTGLVTSRGLVDAPPLQTLRAGD